MNRVRKIARAAAQAKAERTKAKDAQRRRTAENKKRHGITKMAALIGLLLAVLLGAACDPATKAPPVPGRTALVGDSTAFLAGYNGGGFPEFDQIEKVGIGWQAERAQPRLTSDVAAPATSPQRLVVVLGQNDAGIDGLQDLDRQQLTALALSPADGTCTVFVKPWYVGTNQTRLQGIADYRTWVDTIVALNPTRMHSVDWQPGAVQPGALDPDGIHPTPQGAVALNALIRSAPGACDG